MAGHRIGAAQGLALAAAAGPTIALYTPLGMAPLFVLVALLCLIGDWSDRPWRRMPRRPAMVLAAILAWAALSLLWCLDVPQAAHTLGSLVGIAAGGAVLMGSATRLDEVQRRRLRLFLVVGVGVAAVLAIAEILTIGPGSLRQAHLGTATLPFALRFSRGLTVMAVLLAPATWAAWQSGRLRWAGAVAGLAVVAILLGHALSAKIALVLIAAVVLLTRWRAKLGAASVAAFAILIALAFPLATNAPPPQESMDRFFYLTNSAHHRLTIWKFTATKVLEKPILGWGLDAARAVPGAEDVVPVVRHFNLPPGAGPNGVAMTEQMLPLHPHSGPGQVWLELGGIGIVLLGALITVLAGAIPRASSRADGAVWAAVLTAGFVVSSVSYGLWQSWWLSSLWLAAALARAISEEDGNPARPALQQDALAREI